MLKNNFSFLKLVFISILLIWSLVLPNFFIFSQDNPINQNSTSTQDNNSLDSVLERQQLEEELKKLEEELNKINEDITKTEQEKKTLQNQIYILKKKIEKLNIQIEQSNMMIKDLKLQIADTEISINQTSLKIDDSRSQLSNILRTLYEEDQKSLIEILLSERELSGFFDDLMYLENLNYKNQVILEEIKNLKTYLEKEKESLDAEREDLEKLLVVQTLQKQESQTNKTEQEYYLKLTESQYQKQLKEKEEAQKRAAGIRARIFELIGVPKAPTFGEALEIAKFVSAQTGIRAAYLLAVLRVESDIGKNVGQCYLSRDPAENLRKRAMNPERDLPYFLEICQSLGRDPYNTPVSCWIPMYYNGKPYGWGGAMGPAQFIPSTWIKYEDKVQSLTGKPADPWNIKDAFLAAALYLKDLGAETSEWRAAMRYFSGSSWTKYEEYYGNRVITIASQYEEEIREIESAG